MITIDYSKPIEFTNGHSTTWPEVKNAILSSCPIEKIVEARVFGSWIKNPREVVYRQKYGDVGMLLGMFGIDPGWVAKEKPFYVRDLDVLLILDEEPLVKTINPRLFVKYTTNDGYSSFSEKSYKAGDLHLSLTSKERWEKRVEEGNEEAVDIQKNSLVIIENGRFI